MMAILFNLNDLNTLLLLPNKPDAIVTTADKITIGCLRYFKKHYIAIPNDIALIGFSNSELTELLSPALSIVKQPAFYMGEAATNFLLQLIVIHRLQQRCRWLIIKEK